MPKYKVRWREEINFTAFVEADDPAAAYDAALNLDSYDSISNDGQQYAENSFYILEELKDA